MITYLEGLPRSGKSLNSLKDYSIPALKQGREVMAYIEGLNHEKIAELAEITLDECKDLLTQLTREQAKEIHKHFKPNSLLILDEAEQNWPARRQPLDEALSLFVREHGHHGVDIVLMGQTFKELHLTWRSRTAQKNFYLKREAAGKPNEYSVTIQKPVMKGDKQTFEDVQHIKGLPYDTNYFGAYKSHTDNTTNKETFIDERANVWNNPVLKKWLPIYGALFILAMYFVYNAFYGDTLTKGAKEQENKAKVVKTAPAPIKEPVKPIEKAPSIPELKPAPTNSMATVTAKTPLFTDPNIVPDPPPDLIDHLSQSARIRLTGYLRIGNRSEGWIEWRGDGNNVIERMSFQTLKTLGWTVLVNQDMDMAILQNYHKRYIATSWPLPEPKGKMTNQQSDDIKIAQQIP